MNKDDFKNVALAVVLSLMVLFAVETVFPSHKAPSAPAPAPTTVADVQAAESVPSAPAAPTVAAISVGQPVASPTIAIKTDTLHGAIRLKGAVLDSLTLTQFKQTDAADSAAVTLLTPSYYAAFGVSAPNVETPTSETLWIADKKVLTADSVVTLSWTNKAGVRFVRQIALDKDYLFTITDSIDNRSRTAFAATFDAAIVQVNPLEAAMATVHEGFVGVLDDTLKEYKTHNIKVGKSETFTTKGGWLGITEKYWLTALIFDTQWAGTKGTFAHQSIQNQDVFSAYYMTPAFDVGAGQTVSYTSRFFAGPKEEKLLAAYQEKYNINKFELAIDFGWFYFLTKPFLLLLGWLNGLVGNMGVAILIFATFLRLILLPIAGKSYESMAKMRQLQPKIKMLQTTYKNDRMRLNQEMLMLYRREKVNPASGCLPLLIQIPVFFSLYKVLSVSIEMRQAPFFGWIKDLSLPDPSSVFTLFGYVPWPIPSFLNIGVWPLIMGLTMYYQQHLSPQPSDKTQASVMRWLPVLFTFMMGQFAAGLVIYWTWNNILSVAQQRYVMNKYKVK